MPFRKIAALAVLLIWTGSSIPALAQSVLGRSMDIDVEFVLKLCSFGKCTSTTMPIAGKMYVSKQGTLFDYVGKNSGEEYSPGETYSRNNGSTLAGAVKDGKYLMRISGNATIDGKKVPSALLFSLSADGDQCQFAISADTPEDVTFEYSTRMTRCNVYEGNVFAQE